MQNNAHWYRYYALLCSLGMDLYKLCAQRAACNTPPMCFGILICFRSGITYTSFFRLYTPCAFDL